jgi:hypothetical protein
MTDPTHSPTRYQLAEGMASMLRMNTVTPSLFLEASSPSSP